MASLKDIIRIDSIEILLELSQLVPNQARNGNTIMNSMKLVIPLGSLYWSIHTKDESKRCSAFAFICGVN